MKRLMLFLCGSIFIVSSLLRADELIAIKGEIEKLKKESYQQSQTIKSLEQKIRHLEQTQQSQTIKSLEQKIHHLEQTQQSQHDKVASLDTWKAEQEEDTLFLLDEIKRQGKSIKEMIDLHVYGNINFEDFHDNDNRFDAESTELIFSASLTPRISFHGEIEFERPADIGGKRGGTIEFERGYVDYLINSYINMRAGMILIPFGRYNLNHFAPFRDLTDRPLVAKQVIPTDWVEAGAGLFGTIPLTHRFTFDYEVYLINGLNNNITDEGFRDSRPTFSFDNNNNKATVGRMLFKPFSGIELGLSGYFGQYDKDEDNNIAGFALDWQGTYGPFELLGEYALFDVESGLNQFGEHVPNNLKGFYVQTNYHFWPKWLNSTFLGKGFEFPTFTGVLRFGSIKIDDDGDLDNNGNVNSGDNRERRLTIGFNYRPVETFVTKFEYQINQTTNEDLVRGDDNGFIFSFAFAF